MRRIVKIIGRIIAFIVMIIVILLLASTAYHHIMLGVEADKIIPNGKLVEVGGHNIHVYSEGEQDGDKPVLVFMSGAGAVAPVYYFKCLYSLLSDKYRIVVVEKAGYGYSDICEVDRDIDTLLSETRQALNDAGESEPYILFPHSMSGLEAIYWASQYPEEVAGIVGLDMAVPQAYEYIDLRSAISISYLGRAAAWIGLQRLPGIYPLTEEALDDPEIEQQELLLYRNAFNIDYVLEAETVYDNAKKVEAGGPTGVPLLMFVSNGKEIGDYWIPCSESFAQENGAAIVNLDCGHCVHYFEAEQIAQKSLEFIESLGQTAPGSD